MIAKSIRSGMTVVGKKPGLVALIYAVNIFTAFVIAIPLYAGLSSIVGPTGFGSQLAAAVETDVVIWADIIEELNPSISGMFVQLMWILPVVFIAKVVSSVGLINAIRDGGIRSFWPGVGQYGGRAIALGLSYLLLTIIGVVAMFVFFGLAFSLFSGEVGTYRLIAYFIPGISLFFFGLLDLFHDFSRIKLVKDEVPVLKCFLHGFAFPWQHRGSFIIYLFWYAAAFALLLAPIFLDASLAAGSIGGVILLFLLQQVALILRSATSVAWFGSEVAYYEAIDWSLSPMIAGATVPEQSEASASTLADMSE